MQIVLIYYSFPQDFVFQLKDHLLAHLLQIPFDKDEEASSDADWNTVYIINN